MFGEDIVVRTRLLPPRLPRRWLRRTRLDQVLAGAAEYPLTLVCAGAGYGKSSMLASFAARGGWPTIWCSLGPDADDPLVLLLYLIYACRSHAPRIGERALELLAHGGRGPQVWNGALDALINDLVLALGDETILILDDYHLVSERADISELLARLLDRLPPQLHLLLSTRHWPALSSLPTMQARGEVFVLGEAELAFTGEEIGALFEDLYAHSLPEAQVAALAEQTGGWAIALQLIGQQAEGRPAAPAPAQPGSPAAVPREVLFGYLAQEVLEAQPAPVQAFLLRSSVLGELDPVVCDHVLGEAGAAPLLRDLERRGLFLSRSAASRFRYHPLFHAFLHQRARERLPDWADLHLRAASHYRAAGESEPALYHLLTVGDFINAMVVLKAQAPRWLAAGRLVTLLSWLDQVPEDMLATVPDLLLARGDAARMLARFETAQVAYAEAEHRAALRNDRLGQCRAIVGQARVFLDTVHPAPATALLRRAYHLLPGDRTQARAELLALIAENRLNVGWAGQAERLARLAERYGASVAELRPRILLRRGSLELARAALEASLAEERAALADGRPPEAHRSVTLLLSLIAVLQGDRSAALGYARAGLAATEQFGTSLAAAVAHMRLGHALQLADPPDLQAAHQHYLRALALADAFSVPRTKAEAYMGLALLHGFAGEPAAAQAAAGEGLAIAERSGDHWMAALLWLALGVVGVASGAEDAERWLQQAQQIYLRARDSYGQTLVQLWQSIQRHRMGDAPAAAQHAHQAIALAQQHGYGALLTGQTLFGPRDRMALVPVLLAGRANPPQRRTAQEWLQIGFPGIANDEVTQGYHPGSTLRVHLFERLRVWRGGEEIDPRAWQRKKAQQMLALLLTNRHRWLLREQICEWLWPGDHADDAETQFKVTLNALNSALEPSRPPRTAPFYVRRQGGAYRFCPPDGVWLDVEVFEQLLDNARAHLAAGGDAIAAAQEALLSAVGLYAGDYLSDYLYDEWAREERARLNSRYLEAATTLAELLLSRQQLPDVIQLCDMILARDPCWEDAYRLLMRTYTLQGNRRLALSTYQRCVRNLRQHLDVAPLPQTTQVYLDARG